MHVSVAIDGVNNAVQPARRVAAVSFMLESAGHLAAGMVVLFSAVLHENLSFNRSFIAASLLLLALPRLVSALKASNPLGRIWLSVFFSLYEIAAAAIIFFYSVTATAFGVLVFVWAAGAAIFRATGLFLPASLLRLSGLRAAGYTPIFTGITAAFAAFLFAVRADQVSVIGGYGAYAVVFGVFGVIAALDARIKTKEARA